MYLYNIVFIYNNYQQLYLNVPPNLRNMSIMSVLSPYLNIGINLEMFNSSGNVPFLNDGFIRCENGFI